MTLYPVENYFARVDILSMYVNNKLFLEVNWNQNGKT